MAPAPALTAQSPQSTRFHHRVNLRTQDRQNPTDNLHLMSRLHLHLRPSERPPHLLDKQQHPPPPTPQRRHYPPRHLPGLLACPNGQRPAPLPPLLAALRPRRPIQPTPRRRPDCHPPNPANRHRHDQILPLPARPGLGLARGDLLHHQHGRLPQDRRPADPLGLLPLARAARGAGLPPPAPAGRGALVRPRAGGELPGQGLRAARGGLGGRIRGRAGHALRGAAGRWEQDGDEVGGGDGGAGGWRV